MHYNAISTAAEQIRLLIGRQVAGAFEKGELKSGDTPDYEVATPKEQGHGDLFTNFAMQSARLQGLAPRKIAEIVFSQFPENDLVERIEIAGPGFVNFFLKPAFFSDCLSGVERCGGDYGKSDSGRGKKVMVEFVSANPTGPMHMGNARGGVIGDAYATLLEMTGHEVTREFYVNDAGNQVDILGASLDARLIQAAKGEDAAAFPENGYHGDDVKALAAEFLAQRGDAVLEQDETPRRAELVKFALASNIASMKRDLERYKISYDCWFYESSLHQSGYVGETVELLKSRGHTYEKDGALWFKASEFGCEKDEVMRKANGFYTYYAVDLAYHRNKFEKRGFDRVTDVFGADHHGHTVRFYAGLKALGLDPDRLDFILMQLVKLVKDGKEVRMSKRTGKAISLTDLLDEIDSDAARFFFASRTPGSTMVFDLDLAVRQDSDNPVYYVKYAHARICSILRSLEDEIQDGKADCDLLIHPAERELILKIASFPNEIAAAAEAKDPSAVTRYATELAALFHKFYNSCRVISQDKPLMLARIKLCRAVKITLKNVLDVLKVEAPEKM